MAIATPDAMIPLVPSIATSSDATRKRAQTLQSTRAHDQNSTPFPVSSGESEGSMETVREPRARRSASVGGRGNAVSSSSSSSRSRPRSILVSTDPLAQITPGAGTESQPPSPSPESSIESDSSVSPTSESESQSLRVDDSSRTTLSSSCSASGFGADSAASSTRMRATTLSTPCVTFAPLPELGPRKRKSTRPLGIAARGQILRQRRMMMAQDKLSYYDDSPDNTIPGGERTGRHKDGNEKNCRDDLEDTEIALAALGKLLAEGTRNLWHRVAHSRSKDSMNAPSDGGSATQKRPRPSRSFTWGGRLRSKSKPSTTKTDAGSDDDSDDEVDGPWTRRRDEDPMTKTIVEGSDDGLDNFVLAYDAMPACEEEEEEFANARVDEEMRTTVEVHLVKATEGGSDE